MLLNLRLICEQNGFLSHFLVYFAVESQPTKCVKTNSGRLQRKSSQPVVSLLVLSLTKSTNLLLFIGILLFLLCRLFWLKLTVIIWQQLGVEKSLAQCLQRWNQYNNIKHTEEDISAINLLILIHSYYIVDIHEASLFVWKAFKYQ